MNGNNDKWIHDPELGIDINIGPLLGPDKDAEPPEPYVASRIDTYSETHVPETGTTHYKLATKMDIIAPAKTEDDEPFLGI